MKALSLAALVTLLAVPAFAQAIQYTRVDGEDLRIKPSKYVGRYLEVRSFYCYAADPGDYRCTSPEQHVSISGDVIEPPAMREFIETKCSTIRVAATPVCRFTLKFLFEKYEQDNELLYVYSRAIEVPSRK